ncbi:MAG: hypothetical protein JRN15_07020 [Nitrososphaerota archaeon]|nr:hypothetical protein [Nitrososphaerota archaeon]
MEIPFLEFPSYVKQLAADFEPVFEQKRQLQQFERLMSAFPVAERHSIAHMNGMFAYHTNQSNRNRLVTQSERDAGELQKIAVDMANAVEKQGLLTIDDTIVEKTLERRCMVWNGNSTMRRGRACGALALQTACSSATASTLLHRASVSEGKADGRRTSKQR